MSIPEQDVPDHTGKRACEIASQYYAGTISWENERGEPLVSAIAAALMEGNPEKWGPKEPDYEAWRPVLERFHEARYLGIKPSTPLSEADIANIKGLMAVMPAEQPASGDELERAREYAVQACGIEDYAQFTREVLEGRLNDHIAVQSALIAIREEAKRRPTMSEEEIETLTSQFYAIRETLKRVQL